MRKLWIMIKKELREGIATRSFVIGTILTPVVMVALFAVPNWLAERSKGSTYRIAVLEVGAERFAGFGAFVAGDTLPGGQPQWQIEYASAPPSDTARLIEPLVARARDGELDAFLVLDTAVWDTSEAALYSANVSRANLIRELRGRLTDFVVAGRTAALGIDVAQAGALTRRVELATHKVGAKGRSKSEVMSEYFGALIFIMVLFTMIFGYGAQLMRALFEEKSARIIEVLLSSVSPFQLMMSKIVGQGLVALAQVAAWVVLGALFIASGAALTGRVMGGLAILESATFVISFIIFLVLGYLLYSCWFAIVGATVASDQEAQSLIAPVVIILMIPFVLLIAVVDQPNSLLMKAMSILPPFSPAGMVMRLSLSTVPLWELLLSMVLLILAVIGAGWVAARIFRIGILMTGKRPTLPEVLRWVRTR